MTFQFIDDHRDEFPVSRMCKVLDVSRSGYYAWRGRPPSEREMENRKLYKKIEAVYDESGGVYGSPRIYDRLDEQGVICSENRIARLMRLRGLRAKQEKTFKVTTRRNKAHPVAPNLLDRNFEANGLNEIGWRTSQLSIRRRGGCIWPQSWTSSVGGSSGGPCRTV